MQQSNQQLRLPTPDELQRAHTLFDKFRFDGDGTIELSADQYKVLDLGLQQPLSTATLSAPQILANNFGVKRKRFVLSLDKGMGKTLTYLSIMQGLGAERFVILCTKNAMATQRREILKFFPQWADKFTFVHANGSKGRALRKEQWENDAKPIKITTYATFISDIGLRTPGSGQTAGPKIIPARYLGGAAEGFIGDEFHRVLRGRNTKLLPALKEAAPQALILSSGSAVSKSPADLWPALHVIDHKFWSSFWNYVGAYCLVSEGRFGKSIDGPNPARVPAWRQAIGPYLFHRKKDPRDYPPKMRSFLDVELEPWQQHLHDQLREELMADLPSGDLALAGTSLEAVYKCRLSLICPQVLDPAFGPGASLEAILDDYCGSELRSAVISTPFKKPFPFIERFFASHNIPVTMVNGDLIKDADHLDATIKQWEQRGGIFLQTIKFAQSYELDQFTNDMYMLGYEYDPEDNEQAEDRIHRETTKMAKNIWYLRCLDTYDEEHVDILVNKKNGQRLLFGIPRRQ